MIIKTLKRSMAAEYSRELSSKVCAGSRRIAALGFRNGGIAGYGFRRLLVSCDGTRRQILATGERKSLVTDRVILVPGAKDEVQCVQEIYRLFIDERLSTAAIASELNRRGIPYLNGRTWYQDGVYRVLTHPKYCGSHVYGRRSQILHAPSTAMPKSSWCVVPNAFEPIVTRERFEEAQRIIHARTYFKSDDRVLEALRGLWMSKGRLSQKLVHKASDVPSTGTFWTRFGGLRNAYRLIGYTGIQSSAEFTATRRRLAGMKRALIEKIVLLFPDEVRLSHENWRERLRLRLRNNSLVAVYLCQSHRLLNGSLRWWLETNRREFCKLTLLIRLEATNSTVFDFYLLPCIHTPVNCNLRWNDARLSSGIRFTEPGQFLSAVKLIGDCISEKAG
jgi:hypothetical protein